MQKHGGRAAAFPYDQGFFGGMGYDRTAFLVGLDFSEFLDADSVHVYDLVVWMTTAMLKCQAKQKNQSQRDTTMHAHVSRSPPSRSKRRTTGFGKIVSNFRAGYNHRLPQEKTIRIRRPTKSSSAICRAPVHGASIYSVGWCTRCSKKI